jgi:hypothetical protein
MLPGLRAHYFACAVLAAASGTGIGGVEIATGVPGSICFAARRRAERAAPLCPCSTLLLELASFGKDFPRMKTKNPDRVAVRATKNPTGVASGVGRVTYQS